MTVGYDVWWSESVLRLVVLILMLVMGIQDLRTRKVSNWLTIPFFFTGLIANILRFYTNVEIFQLVMFFQGAVVMAGYYGWMGGADMKVFGGLLGLVPTAGIAAFIATGMWGAVVWIYTRRKDATFPAVTIIAFLTGLTFIGELSIMPSLGVMRP
jgi:Flp pilus assembly protein protease CpaA